MCGKSHIYTILLTICSRTKTDIALNLLSVAATVNATFPQYLHLGAKLMVANGFEGHLQMVQICMQIYFFELNLPIIQLIAQICYFARLCFRCKSSFANVSEICNLNNVCSGCHGWSNFHNWNRLLCLANVTKLLVLNKTALEADVSKPKFWKNFLGLANLIKQKIWKSLNLLFVAANVVKIH